MYNSPYRNVLNCVQRVYQKEGIFAFYRSYTTQLAMNVPFQSIHFIAYEFAQTITNPEHVYNPIAHIGSGELLCYSYKESISRGESNLLSELCRMLDYFRGGNPK